MNDNDIRQLGVIPNAQMGFLARMANLFDAEELNELRKAVCKSQDQIEVLHAKAVDNEPIQRKLTERTDALEKASYFLEWLQTHHGMEFRRMLGDSRSKMFTDVLIQTARALK